MAKQEKRRMMGIPLATNAKIEFLQGMLRQKTGYDFTKTQVIQRALEILEDAYGRGAWLSPVEAGPVIQARHKREIASVLGQFIAMSMPDARLDGVLFDEENGQLTIRLLDTEDGEIRDCPPLRFGGVDFPQGSQG